MTTEEINTEYHIPVSKKLKPDFRFTVDINNWLKDNLTNLRDDDNNQIFSKVNTGYNEDNLKHFGVKPVCDVYVDHVEYDTDFTYHKPENVSSVILFYRKGANNTSYDNMSLLHDYIMQEFLTNDDYMALTGIVKDTWITNSQVMVQRINKKWGVMGAFELTHELY